MFARHLVALATLALMTVPTGIIPTADAMASCTADHVWFLGVVYDDARRNDFQEDVDNFEYFLDELGNTYCIPSSQSEILAFDNNYSRGGVTYDEATEANVKKHLDDFATAANAHSDSKLFFFLSSHGLMYPTGLSSPITPCGTNRVGSFSALKATSSSHPLGAQDGNFHDCELSDELTAFNSNVEMFIAVDCSFCGGFSNSLTAVSGTVPDGTHPLYFRNVPGPNRIVITGCAITTECFGSSSGDGAVLYKHMKRVLDLGASHCDGWTAPGFPTVQGINAPLKIGPTDGECSASEWFYASVDSAYKTFDVIGIQEQFRMKFGSTVSDMQIR